MQPAIIIVVLCILAVVAFLMVRGRFGGQSTAWGFREWVKNPNFRRSAEQYFAERDALTVPDDISQSEIQAMIDRLFVKEDNDFNFEKLRLMGDKATPLLMAALNTDRTFNMKFSDGGHVLDAKSPLERICNLLRDAWPVAAVKPMARFASHPDDEFREHAASALGNIGSDECIAHVAKLLRDEDDCVRSCAMTGIKSGITNKRCTDTFLTAVLPAVELLLDSDETSDSESAPSLMLAIDQERAIQILFSDKYFTHEYEQLHAIIEACNEAKVPIPHHKLLPMIDATQPLADEYPHGYTLAAALIAYANNPNSKTEAFLTTLQASEHNQVAKAAADGLRVILGVTDPSSFVFEQLDSHGWSGLTAPQKHYYAVFMYDSEVNNGGHSQYFVNSSGDNHSTALAGLRAIGAVKRAGILSQALQLFGGNGPSVDHERRHEELAAFSKHQDSELNSLDSQYYECDESINRLLSSYALANKTHFMQVK